MKRILFSIFLLFPSLLMADGWSRAVSRNAGNYPETATVTVTTYTATEIIDEASAIKAASIDVFVNNAFTLWIGSNTTDLSTIGFPIMSSKTYTTDGTFTGSLYGTVDPSATASQNVRVIYWQKNDYAR